MSEYQDFIELEHHIIRNNNFTVVCESKQPPLVVITIPHDTLPKQELLGFSNPRGKGVKGRDNNVWPIVRDILLEVSRLQIPKQISTVRALMWRGFVDCNRSYPDGINYYPINGEEAHTALENLTLEPIYYTYHTIIENLINKAIACYGKTHCLLLDLHGFNKQPPYAPSPRGYDLILGTGNRSTILHEDIDQHLGNYLKERGYSVFVPAKESADGERLEDMYAADFTTRHYSETFSINTIQIEIAPWFRDRDSTMQGQNLSRDLAEFLEKTFFRENLSPSEQVNSLASQGDARLP